MAITSLFEVSSSIAVFRVCVDTTVDNVHAQHFDYKIPSAVDDISLDGNTDRLFEIIVFQDADEVCMDASVGAQAASGAFSLSGISVSTNTSDSALTGDNTRKLVTQGRTSASSRTMPTSFQLLAGCMIISNSLMFSL